MRSWTISLQENSACVISLETSSKCPGLGQGECSLGDLQGKPLFLDGLIWSQIIVSPAKRWIVVFPDEAGAKYETSRKKLAEGTPQFVLGTHSDWKMHSEWVYANRALGCRSYHFHISLYVVAGIKECKGIC